jgi:hypothetical protein
MSVDELVARLDGEGRVCPLPRPWDRLHRHLTSLKPGDADRPPVPLILAGWNFSSDSEKRMRLIDQLDWARQHGVLVEARVFLAGLSPDDWHTGD